MKKMFGKPKQLYLLEADAQSSASVWFVQHERILTGFMGTGSLIHFHSTKSIWQKEGTEYGMLSVKKDETCVEKDVDVVLFAKK